MMNKEEKLITLAIAFVLSIILAVIFSWDFGLLFFALYLLVMFRHYSVWEKDGQEERIKSREALNIEIKTDTHLVLKIGDIARALDNEQQKNLDDIISSCKDYRASLGKVGLPRYIVVNEDEPYFADIVEVLAKGEFKKRGVM